MVTVTLKLTPTQWDDVLASIEFAKSAAEDVAQSKDADVRERSAARVRAVRLTDLLRAMRQ